MNVKIGDEVHEIAVKDDRIQLSKYVVTKILGNGFIEIKNDKLTQRVNINNENIFFSCDEAFERRKSLLKEIKFKQTQTSPPSRKFYNNPTKKTNKKATKSTYKSPWNPTGTNNKPYQTKRITLVSHYPTGISAKNSRIQQIGKSYNIVHSSYNNVNSSQQHHIIGLLSNIKKRKNTIYSNWHPDPIPYSTPEKKGILPNTKNGFEIIKNSAGIVIGIKEIK